MCFLGFFWNKKWKQSWHWSNKKYKHAYAFSCMMVDWDWEPGNSLLYLRWEVGITLSIHLLFDLQKMMNSVLHGEKGRWMHSVFYLFGAFFPPVYWGTSYSRQFCFHQEHVEKSVFEAVCFLFRKKTSSLRKCISLGVQKSRAHIILRHQVF